MPLVTAMFARSSRILEPVSLRDSVLKLVLICFVLGITTPAWGQAQFWLSASDQSSAVPTAPLDKVQPNGTSGMVHIWAKPESGKSIANFSLNLVSSSDTVLRFDSVEVHNDLNNGQSRFEFTVDTVDGLDLSSQEPCGFDDPFEAPTHAIWGVRGFTITEGEGDGLSPTTIAEESHYDSTNETWLLASVGITGLELGEADLSLQIGHIGINQAAGDTEESSESLQVEFAGDGNLLNAKNQRCISTDPIEATISVEAPIVGDFNFNGELDAGDIDLLSVEAKEESPSPAFNIAGDAEVDASDRIFWVENLKGTFLGDANLDGKVDFFDFIDLANGFNKPGGWANGDFNGNQMVDFLDFIDQASNFGQPKEEAAFAVPEPSSASLFLWLTMPLLLLWRCRH